MAQEFCSQRNDQPGQSAATAPSPLVAPSPWIPSPLLSASFCFLLTLAMHLPWLGCTPIAGTEGHRIFPAHEMVRSGNWLVPMLFGQPFITKPPLHHWLIAVSEWLGSNNPNLPNDPTPRDLFLWRLPSALMGAALCAMSCLFGARWFGKTAGLIAGMAAVGMIAIWGQAQVADIDSTNTFAAALTAFCGIELYIASPSRQWPWVSLASAGMAATWMTKGPAGLTIAAGVWLWAAVVFIREKHSSRLVAPAFWLPIVLGPAAFGVWILAAKAELARMGMSIDKRGAQEVTDLLLPTTFKAWFVPLFSMLPQVILFALPMSASLLFFRDREVRERLEPAARRIAGALVAAVFISWGIAVISAIANPLWINPRYYYPTLLPLCPLSGAVAVAALKTCRPGRSLLGAAIATAVALTAGAIGLAAASWSLIALRPLLILCPLLALVALVWTLLRLRRSWTGAWGLVVLLFLTSVSFGAQRHLVRTRKDSAIATAARLRQIIGEHTVIYVSEIVTSKPETFTYAHVHAVYFPYNFLPRDVPPGNWVILNRDERKGWLRIPGVRLEREQKLCRNGEMDYYLAWYAGTGM